MCGNCGCPGGSEHRHDINEASVASSRSTIDIHLDEDILRDNDAIANQIRQSLTANGTLGVNLMSSPGSGKTRLLEETARRIGAQAMAVIEGDLETENDADRIRKCGVAAHQITTGMACHLDATMVKGGVDQLAWQSANFLFIENVGNLICPATFDLGQHHNVVLLSVTEGADKAEKYPVMFRSADCVLITKSDLLDKLDDFELGEAVRSIRSVNPNALILSLSSKSGQGFDSWIDWLSSSRSKFTNVG